MPGTESKSFMDMMQEGRKVPENLEGTATEFPGFFSNSRGPVVKDTPGEKLGVETNCVSFSEVFLLWRPWNECQRCVTKIHREEIALPEDTGDHTCPHVQNDEYKRVVDKCLRGDALLQARNYFNLKDGTRCVHIEWMEYDGNFLRDLQKKEEIRKKFHVYPPDPVAAFSEEKIERKKD